METLGLLAGIGHLPVDVAQSAKKLGYKVVAIAVVPETDPELPANGQVLSEVRFMSREEVAQLEHVYPEFLRTELWEHLEQGTIDYDAFRMRDE